MSRADGTPRIATLTLNPAVDLAGTAFAVRPTHKIRTFDERYDAGGGGINVARVVHALGGDALALIMAGGATGQLLQELIHDSGVPCRALPIAGRTRICLNVHENTTGAEFRFVSEGPEVTPAEWRGALDALRRIRADWIVASGSLPRGVPADFYAQAAAIAMAEGREFALDTSGDALRAAARLPIALLKMSQRECESLTDGQALDPDTLAKTVGERIARGGPRRIAVSLGAEGALLATPQGIHRADALPVPARSSVGAGDSFLAGLVLGLAWELGDAEALRLANAVGAAAVASYGTAQVALAAVEALYGPLPKPQEGPGANGLTEERPC